MISINLSIDQLIDTVKHLSNEEKNLLRDALDNDDEIYVSQDKIKELLNRKQDFMDGNISSRSWESIKNHYESI